MAWAGILFCSYFILFIHFILPWLLVMFSCSLLVFFGVIAGQNSCILPSP